MIEPDALDIEEPDQLTDADIDWGVQLVPPREIIRAWCEVFGPENLEKMVAEEAEMFRQAKVQP